MKGTQLLLLDHFVKDGRRRKFTIKEVSEEVTLTRSQNASHHVLAMKKLGWLEPADGETNPVYYRMSDLGFKIYKGVRNIR